AGGGVPEDGDAQVEMVARPALLEHRELAAEGTAHAREARLEALRSLLPTEAMGNRDDNRPRHQRRLPMTVKDDGPYVGSLRRGRKRRRAGDPCRSVAPRAARSHGIGLTESAATDYIGGVVNNRKEVIQCLIVSRPGRRPIPGSSPLSRSA